MYFFFLLFELCVHTLLEWMHSECALCCIPWFYNLSSVTCTCILLHLGDSKHNVILRCFLVHRYSYAYLLVLWETVCAYVFPFSMVCFFLGVIIWRIAGVCMYVYLYVCVYIHAHLYIHTHIYSMSKKSRTIEEVLYLQNLFTHFFTGAGTTRMWFVCYRTSFFRLFNIFTTALCDAGFLSGWHLLNSPSAFLWD
jgi:hypothetical protein